MRIRPLKPAQGFTLIELLVVMTLIVILASMAMGQYRSSVLYAREAVLKRDLFVMRDAIDQYYADKSEYPTALQALAAEGYVRKIVEDPLTNDVDSWLTIPAEPDPSNPRATGIYDVKSGSDRTALDGRKYADW